MGMRWLVAIGAAFAGGEIASAQVIPPPAAVIGPAAMVREPVIPTDPPVTFAQGQSPLLLPVPQTPESPLAVVPRPGPSGIDYDPGYQYLPEQAPERSPVDSVCGPMGRWWITPSLELAWVPTRPAPTNLRLPIPPSLLPDNRHPGVRVPVAGLATDRFEPAFGLVVGHWFDENHTYGVEASFFTRDANTIFYGTAHNLELFFPNGPDRSAPQIIGLPNTGVLTTFPVTMGTYFATADVDYRHRLYCTENARLDALVGYRYAFLGDEIYLGELPDGNHQDFRLNRAAVSNNFNGGQVGLAGEYRVNRWYVASSAKLAFGATTTNVTTSGLFTDARGLVNGTSHRLNALAAVSQNEFAVLPAFNVQVGRQVFKHARIFAGYSFLYLSRAGRLGDALNPSNTGLSLTDFWVQTISLGADFRF